VALGITFSILYLFPFQRRYWGVVQASQGFGHIAGYFGIHPKEYK